MRILKAHWKMAMVSTVLVFVLAIGIGFYSVQRGWMPTAIPATLVAIMAPTLYYFYTEVLDRPLLSIHTAGEPLSVAPMFRFVNSDKLGELDKVDTPTSHFLRPAVFYNISIENHGKATAREAVVHIRLVPEDNRMPDFDYYGRWSDPENSVRYDLLPGQSRNVHVMKVFLTTDFFPILDITSKDGVHREAGVEQVAPPGNPPGLLRYFSNVEPDDVDIQPLIPREKRPEKEERSIHGGWEGKNIARGLESIETEYQIKVRVIADDYKTDWSEELGNLSILECVRRTGDDAIWQDQWSGLGNLKPEIDEAVSEWLSEGD